MENPLIGALNAQYAATREKNEREMYARKKKLYLEIPRLKAIDDELASIARNIILVVTKNPDDLQDGIAEMSRVSEHLRSERKVILDNHGYATDYLSPIYTCKFCKDRGYLDSGHRCQCFQKSLVEMAFEKSDLRAKLAFENFSTFDISRFDDKVDRDYDQSPQENMKQIYHIAKHFIDDFDNRNGDNLLFYGQTGRGKTFMCSAIAKALIEKGKTVVYQTAYDLFATAKAHAFDYDISSEDKTRYEMLSTSDLLIIDDLGTELVNTLTHIELFQIINNRMLMEKKTIISTNLNLANLNDTYGERMFSRFLGHYQLIEFFGSDLRTQ